MKRMELKITLTFAIMFVVGVIISGIESVVSKQSVFFTFEVMADGLFTALVYLGYIWINTRRHQLLTYLGVLGIGFMVMFAAFSSEGVSGAFSGWNWKDTIMCIYYIVVYQIASYQGKKLLEEDKETINLTINLHGENGSLIRPGCITENFRKLINENGLKKITIKDLRHSCASLLLANDINMKQIQEWLGHSNFSTTANIYSHLEKDTKEISANAIETAFEKKSA